MLTDTDKKKMLVSRCRQRCPSGRRAIRHDRAVRLFAAKDFQKNQPRSERWKGFAVVHSDILHSVWKQPSSERYVLKDNYKHRKTNFWCAPGRWSRGSADGAAKEMWDRIKRGWVTGEGGGVEAGGRSPEIKSVSEMLQKHAVNTFSSILSRETKAQRYATQTQIHIKKKRKTVKPNQHHFICCKTNNNFSQ